MVLVAVQSVWACAVLRGGVLAMQLPDKTAVPQIWSWQTLQGLYHHVQLHAAQLSHRVNCGKLRESLTCTHALLSTAASQTHSCAPCPG